MRSLVRKPSPTFAALIAVALGAVAPSCLLTNESPDAGTNVPSNRCDTDAQCAGAVCDRDRHVCVAMPGARTEVVFSALPPAGRPTDTATATTLEARSVGSFEGAVDIALAAPRVVAGRVVAVTASGTPAEVEEPVAATVRFERRGSTPAEGVTELQVATSPTVAGGEYTFSSALVPGTYDVTVTPTDVTRLPPRVLSGVEVLAPDESNRPQELALRYEGLVEISVSVVDVDTSLPVPGLSVRAVDPARDGALVSTTGTTDAYGAVHLRMPREMRDQAWSLQLTSAPRENEEGAPDWRLTYRVDRPALGAFTPGLTASESVLAAVRVPRAMSYTRDEDGDCAACVELEATVEGQTQMGSSVGVAGASLDFHAEDVLGMLPSSQHHAWFDLRAVSQADGTVRARVLPGTYRTVVTPPSAMQFAVTSVDLPVLGPGPYRGRVLALRSPVAVTGFVRDAARGVPMANTTIEAVPLRSVLDAVVAAPTASMRLARAARTTTGATGQYGLRLDPGAYRLIARPGAGSGYAAQVFPTTLIVPEATGTDAPAAITQQDFQLEPPLSVSGTVTGSDGAILQGALVRAFARLRFEGGRTLDFELTSASADARGRYALLLPSQLLR